MGWLIEGLVTVFTASLIVVSNGAVEDRQNVGLLGTHDANRRLPVLPRQVLDFHNNTRVSETSSDTSLASATHIDSIVFTSTEKESSSTPTSREHTFPSALSTSESILSIPSRTSSNAPSTSSTPYSSGTILQSVKKGANTRSTTSIPTLVSSPVQQAKYTSSALSKILSSSTQLPATMTDLFHIVWDSLSHISSSSRAVNVTVASATASCTSPTLSSTTPTLPVASSSTTRLPLHTVSDLVNWLSLASSTVNVNNGRSSSSATTTTSTPTIIVPQETVSISSETSINFFTSPTAVLRNTSTVSLASDISSEASVINIDWISLVFTCPNSHTIIPTSSILPARPTTSVSSSLFSNGKFSGSVHIASPTVPSRSVIPDISGSTAVPIQGNSTVSSSEIPYTLVLSTGSLASRTRSGISIQTRTVLQPSSLSESFSRTSPIPTPTRSSSSTTVSETLSGQLLSSIISSVQPATTPGIDTTSSVALLPFPVISSAFTNWRNASASRTIQGSRTFTKSIFPTRVGSSCIISTTGSSHMSRASSLCLSSISRSAVPSTSVTPSSFMTKTKTRNSEPSSQTTSGTDGIRETIKGQSTALPPTSSLTETEAATAPHSLKPSETAGVVVGSTAGILLAIVAAIFLVRRYHALKHDNDESGPYPKMAYLYDPFPDNPESDSGGDEASTLMSGGAGVRPSASSKSRELPRAPHNSLDYEYGHVDNVDTVRYSDPGNPFLDWRSSRVISTPNDSISILAAAVTGYSKGPQKPLPPLPSPRCTLGDHIIPSPTLSPLPNECGLRRSQAISARNSVKSQRSLRRLNYLNPSPKSYTPLPQHTKTQRLNLTSTHDLPLPVDVRSETPESITLYANPSSYHHHLLPTVFSADSSSKITISASVTVNSSQTPRSSLSSSTHHTIIDDSEEIRYSDFPSPPAPTPPRRHKRRVDTSEVSNKYMIVSACSNTTDLPLRWE